MRKYILPGLILVLIVATMWGGSNLPIVHGSNTSQTIPTRTPTPAPPTSTPSGGGNNPTPTNTPSDNGGPTPTSTLLPVNIAPTPVGGFLPTAVPCGSSPTIQTLGVTNVRSGPGVAYEKIGELVFLEVRYIVGRAETAAWWLIQFNNGDLGWVADSVVTVQGYTPIVPIVEAPPLAGGTPTPGASWNPTPPPFCTVTPPPTSTATAVPTETEPVEVAESVATPTAMPTDPPATEARPTSTPIVQPTAVSLNPTATVAISDPLPPDESSSNLGLIVLGAAALLGAGIFLFTRNRSG
ncbi:hypothetical protein [Candidatus Leptofilum sp.]|uniref:hypothetical protein n=1 Tax=Candidatus Leptofilum sp. TaxID=3241576 RepID=UPI003B5C0710